MCDSGKTNHMCIQKVSKLAKEAYLVYLTTALAIVKLEQSKSTTQSKASRMFVNKKKMKYILWNVIVTNN